MKEIEFIDSMKVLKIEPGDILVLKTDKYISGDNAKAISDYFKDIFKKFDNKVLLLSDGMDIGILRKKND